MELQLLIAFFCSFACLTYVMFHLPDASKRHLCIKVNISKMEIADSARYCCFTYLLTHIYFEKTFKIYPTPDHVTSSRECILSESVALFMQTLSFTRLNIPSLQSEY